MHLEYRLTSQPISLMCFPIPGIRDTKSALRDKISFIPDVLRIEDDNEHGWRWKVLQDNLPLSRYEESLFKRKNMNFLINKKVKEPGAHPRARRVSNGAARERLPSGTGGSPDLWTSACAIDQPLHPILPGTSFAAQGGQSWLAWTRSMMTQSSTKRQLECK